MKKLKIGKMMSIFLLLLAGCQSQNPDNIEIEKENFPDVTEQETPTTGEKKVIEKEDLKASQKISEDGTSKEVWDEAITLADGKVFGELTEVGTEDAVYCNLPENLNDVPYGVKLLLVCPDPLYEINYYVDYGGDYFIHAVKEEKEEVAVKIPARRLFCRGGKLYFMVEDYGKYRLEGLENGDILTYDPNNGEVSVVLTGLGGEMTVPEKTVTSGETTIEVPEKIKVVNTFMTIYQDGIYYQQKGEDIPVGDQDFYVPVNNYFYSFETEKLSRIDSALGFYTFTRWKEYLIAWDLEDTNANPKLFDIKTKEKRTLGMVWNVCFVAENNIYTIVTSGQEWTGEGYSYKNAYSEIVAYSLETGEEKRYRMDKAEDKYTSCFFLFNNAMYFSDLYYYSLKEEKGGYAYSSLQNKNDVGFPIVSEFYTDGKQLYGLSALDGKLYRIEQQEDSYTVPGTKHTYDRRFDFLPIGE